MQPRIYVYKITFVGQPYWYWGVHKERRYGEYYMGSPVTNKKYWELYEPVKDIVETFDFSDEGYSLAKRMEDHLISIDINNPLCLNENYGGVLSLDVLRKSWEDPSRKKKASKLLSELCCSLWKNPSYKELHSEKMKLQWKDPKFQEASERNKRGTGTMWITDGTKEGSRKIKRGENIPEGFRPGRVCR